MNTRVPETPQTMRKMPQQSRSRFLVGIILDVATRILAEKGWAKFNTNDVARTAGVSIGSLYQYFPNKLALAEAIRQQHLAAILAVFDTIKVNKPAETDTFSADVERMIDGIIAAHLINPRLHRILLDEVPLSGRDAHQEFECRYAEFYLTFAARQVGTARAKIASQVLASAIEGVVHDALRREQLLSSELKSELILLVKSYLTA
ncbi:TetR/AcrR family transcriptional regulator [Candidatus Pantoea multigeneris]|uniref:TetR/AcrR family transcriptional regulator n=1 Tax=Candidatus Pantoea multigeneris TaxID=2608357 RepID=A0ABX0RDD0_9GAMM|nr:TetR/AcrR family transcriptional regulator [Pantoea multigeneris]